MTSGEPPISNEQLARARASIVHTLMLNLLRGKRGQTGPHRCRSEETDRQSEDQRRSERIARKTGTADGGECASLVFTSRAAASVGSRMSARTIVDGGAAK